MKQFLLCTDLDRTLIPNGIQPESPLAMERFRKLVGRSDVLLAYVTGRHRALVEQAIEEYALPQPDFVIADVGTTIYLNEASVWRAWQEWDALIDQDWQGWTHDDLGSLLSCWPALQLQETEKQACHKLSFYVALEVNAQDLIRSVDAQLMREGIRANLIWSIDEAIHKGLLDVLPASANKLHAIHFLMSKMGFDCDNTVFSGDSGNDLDVLLSDIPSVLVANADAEIKSLVVDANRDTLYVAKGGYLGMNGNYSAGILEGVAHYWPGIVANMNNFN